MKTRKDIYEQEVSGIIRDVTEYHLLNERQIMGLYPGKEKVIPNLLEYLCHQRRIYRVNGLYFQAPGPMQEVDQPTFKAVSVLVDMIEDVTYHGKGDPPAQILLMAKDEIYEIVYVAIGQEPEISDTLTERNDSAVHYIVIVDNIEQIKKIHIPHTAGYCVVSDDGEVQYFQRQGGHT